MVFYLLCRRQSFICDGDSFSFLLEVYSLPLTCLSEGRLPVLLEGVYLFFGVVLSYLVGGSLPVLSEAGYLSYWRQFTCFIGGSLSVLSEAVYLSYWRQFSCLIGGSLPVLSEAVYHPEVSHRTPDLVETALTETK